MEPRDISGLVISEQRIIFKIVIFAMVVFLYVSANFCQKLKVKTQKIMEIANFRNLTYYEKCSEESENAFCMLTIPFYISMIRETLQQGLNTAAQAF